MTNKHAAWRTKTVGAFGRGKAPSKKLLTILWFTSWVKYRWSMIIVEMD
jgi:hypothetical protein